MEYYKISGSLGLDFLSKAAAVFNIILCLNLLVQRRCPLFTAQHYGIDETMSRVMLAPPIPPFIRITLFVPGFNWITRLTRPV